MSPLFVLCQSQSFERSRGVACIGWIAVASRIKSRHGITGFWRGNLVQCAHGFPEKGLTFVFYEATRRAMEERGVECPVPESCRCFVTGAIAGTTATVLLFPLETFSARLAVGVGKHAMHRGLYNGIGATVLSIAPTMGITLGLYHSVKARLGENPHAAQIAAAAGFSAVVGSTTTWPIYGIRQRVQFVKGASKGLFATATDILKNEGVGGLYVGCRINMVKISIKSSIQFTLYEKLMTWLEKYQARRFDA